MTGKARGPVSETCCSPGPREVIRTIWYFSCCQRYKLSLNLKNIQAVFLGILAKRESCNKAMPEYEQHQMEVVDRFQHLGLMLNFSSNIFMKWLSRILEYLNIVSYFYIKIQHWCCIKHSCCPNSIAVIMSDTLSKQNAETWQNSKISCSRKILGTYHRD